MGGYCCFVEEDPAESWCGRSWGSDEVERLTGSVGGQGDGRRLGGTQGSEPALHVPPAGTQLSQAVIRQYYQPPDLLDLFGSLLQLDLEEIFPAM